MTSLRIDVAPLELLQSVLPKLLGRLSIARAQIAIDQIRATIDSASHERLLFLTLVDPSSPESVLAAAIAIQQSPLGEAEGSDMATIVHAGWLETDHTTPEKEWSEKESAKNRWDMTPGGQQSPPMIRSLKDRLDQELLARGVSFLQWATDSEPTPDSGLATWCRGLGMHRIGTLDYMNGEVQEEADHEFDPPNSVELRFEPLDWNVAGTLKAFSQVVELTYESTMDCPELAEYRTAEQTLRGYQLSAALDPSLWFRVFDKHEALVGCLVLASHRDTFSDPPDQSATVTELVYMGLVPTARGKGYGECLVRRALQEVRRSGGRKLILAVDQKNDPARTLYVRMGLVPMLSETVWVKRLEPARKVMAMAE